MKRYTLIYLLLLTLLWLPCYAWANQTTINSDVPSEISSEIQRLNDTWEQGLIQGDIEQLISLYSKNSIFMPEYQPTLNGVIQIQEYFESLASRRTIYDFSLNSEEMLDLNGYVLEIGSFETSIGWSSPKKIVKQPYTGKYWRVWQTNKTDPIKLIGEAFGFFESIQNPQFWVTDLSTQKSAAPSGFKPADASVELKAYLSLGQKGVQQKNGMLRSQLYAQDAVFYPYADTEKRGIEVLRPYLIKYSSHGAIINSVQTYIHDVLYLNDYILEFAKFTVTWTFDEMPVQASGKGIKLRKRIDNGELRIYRHIGMHNIGGG